MGSMPKSQVEAVNAALRERHLVNTQLKEQLKKAQDRMKRYADLNINERKLSVGTWIYLKIQPYRQVTLARNISQKLSPKFYGPFEVIRKIGDVAYELNLPPGSTIHPIFHISQLKERLGKDQAVSPTIPLTYSQLPIRKFPVSILDRRMVKRHNAAVTQVLIKWSNRADEDSTWEDYHSISSRFPEFFLGNKEGLKGRGMSHTIYDLGVAVENTDSGKQKNGEEEE